MGYEHTNSRGVKYYLHQRGPLFFFSKDEKDSISLPNHLTVIENPRSSFPMVKKK
jgi:hypothetical protein